MIKFTEIYTNGRIDSGYITINPKNYVRLYNEENFHVASIETDGRIIKGTGEKEIWKDELKIKIKEIIYEKL